VIEKSCTLEKKKYMNPIRKAVDDVKFTIPPQILDAVFIKDKFNYRNTPINIDQQMINEVIRPRVLVDCNLIGGTMCMISLAGLEQERVNNYTVVIRIPKERTQGRSIISALNLTYADPAYAESISGNSLMGGGDLVNLTRGLLNSASNIPAISTASVQIIGENVVMIRDANHLPGTVYLRCMIANDSEMNHLQLRSYRNFSKACEYAIKAYIYNQYIIRMGQAELYGGQELGVFKDIISGYADSNELYETYLREKLQKVLFMNDRESHDRLLKSMISQYH